MKVDTYSPNTGEKTVHFCIIPYSGRKPQSVNVDQEFISHNVGLDYCSILPLQQWVGLAVDMAGFTYQ